MKPIKSNIAIMIMAAGASSRMGIAKQLLPWGKSTLIGNAIKNAKESNCSNVFVVLGANADAIKNSVGLKEEAIILNNDWESGLGKCSSRQSRNWN